MHLMLKPGYLRAFRYSDADAVIAQPEDIEKQNTASNRSPAFMLAGASHITCDSCRRTRLTQADPSRGLRR